MILDYISKTQSRFSESDVKRALAIYVTDSGMLRATIDRALSSQKLVSLPTGDFTTRDYRDAELTLLGLSKSMSNTGRYGINPHHLSRAIKTQNKIMNQDFGGKLSQEQIAALRHITSDKQLTCVVGLAGAGKSTLLDVANKAWIKQGLTVHGAALSGKAADGLQTSSNIKSRTLASLELSWKNGYEPIKRGDVLVIDETGMIGTRQLKRITDTGPRAFAVGDRLVFTQNDRTMGVKNGMLGTVQAIKDSKIVVIPDGQDSHVTIDTKHYNSFDHGYAVTIHKSQGATVDHTYVLGSRTLDASLTYVAMTRHRDNLKLYINEKDRPKWIEQKTVPQHLIKHTRQFRL